MTSAAVQQIESGLQTVTFVACCGYLESPERLVGNCQLIGYKTPQTISWESKLN
jgi:sortase (surface protein transpeptidase)